MSNFTIIDTKTVLFGMGKHLANVIVRCNNCKESFKMSYLGTMNKDGTWDKKYEYEYCPHCAKELDEYE